MLSVGAYQHAPSRCHHCREGNRCATLLNVCQRTDRLLADVLEFNALYAQHPVNLAQQE